MAMHGHMLTCTLVHHNDLHRLCTRSEDLQLAVDSATFPCKTFYEKQGALALTTRILACSLLRHTQLV